MDTNLIFIELINEMLKAKNIKYLTNLKSELELDLLRVGEESRLVFRYKLVNEAIEKLSTK